MRIGYTLVPLLCGAMLVGACEDRRRGDDDLARARDEAADKVRAAKDDLKDAEKRASDKIDDAEKKLREKASDVRGDLKTDREAYRADLKKDLVQLDEDMAELREDAKNATGQPKRDLEQALAGFDLRRKNLEKEIEQINTTNEADWAKFRDKVDSSVKSLKKDVDDALDRRKRSKT